MQPRRSLRLLVGALVLAAPLLASCGFDKATDKVYTPGAGTNNRDGQVDVLSAVIVSAQSGSGTFLASLSNNSTTEDATLASVAAAGASAGLTVSPTDLSIDVPARGFVNLVDEAPITVSGDFFPGQVENLTLTFDSGDTVTMDVPVVYACNYYEGLDRSGSAASSSASSSASPSASESPSAGEVPSESSTASESTSSSPSSSATGEAYDCSAVGEE